MIRQYAGLYTITPQQNHQLCGMKTALKTQVHRHKDLSSNHLVVLSSFPEEVRPERSYCLSLSLPLITHEPVGCLQPKWQYERGHKITKF